MRDKKSGRPVWSPALGDSVGIRTLDPQIRNLLLYPAELRNRAPFLFRRTGNGLQIYEFSIENKHMRKIFVSNQNAGRNSWIFPSVHWIFMFLSNIQKITCIILRNLFGLYLFSHQSCATGTLLLQKKIYPRKSSLNLKQLIISCS